MQPCMSLASGMWHYLCFGLLFPGCLHFCNCLLIVTCWYTGSLCSLFLNWFFSYFSFGKMGLTCSQMGQSSKCTSFSSPPCGCCWNTSTSIISGRRAESSKSSNYYIQRYYYFIRTLRGDTSSRNRKNKFSYTAKYTQSAQHARQQTFSLFSKNLGDQHSSIVTSKVRDNID